VVAGHLVEPAAGAAALAPGGTAIPLADVPIETFDVVVNATPLGMRGEPPPFDPARLRPGQFVYDTVYPAETPLLAEARARGAGAAGGLGMLVHQGALSFELWTGCTPSLPVMRVAAAAAEST
jgi:shikimate 5-dehydrogenase